MRKPILLVVDDDPAVLGALEVQLRPKFEEIATIEAFDGPHPVLAAMDRWREEMRSVAVTIVDQKMPGMSGVELVARLRTAPVDGGRHPASHMQALLLTGQAGLESAIAAKNDAGVARYVEKPWDPGALSAAVSLAMAEHLREAGNSRFLVFREVSGAAEVRAHLALRFRAYRTRGRSAHLVPDKGVGLDLDSYDAVSRHFGLFLEEFGETRLVGTLRVTGKKPSPALALLETLVGDDSDLAARWCEPRQHPLPMMKYLIDREAVARLVTSLESAGGTIVEPGRLAVAPELYDVLKRAARNLAPHIVESAVAFFFFFDIRHAALTCDPTHVRFYTTVGFADAPGTERRHHAAFDAVVVCLYASRDAVPEAALGRVLAMAERIRKRGEACRCPSFPECLGGPYETGDFRTVDVFCPLRAGEILGKLPS